MKQVSNIKNLLVLSSSLLHSFYSARSFSKYCLVLLLTCTTLFISSCKKDDKGPKTVPFEVVFQVKSEVTQPGPPTLISATGTGDGTPIGKSSFLGHAKIDASNNFTDDGTITVADGDKIFETTKGPSPLVVDPVNGNVLIISQNIITGGTGKYAGATGSYTTIIHSSFYSPDGIDSLKGTITLNQ